MRDKDKRKMPWVPEKSKDCQKCWEGQKQSRWRRWRGVAEVDAGVDCAVLPVAARKLGVRGAAAGGCTVWRPRAQMLPAERRNKLDKSQNCQECQKCDKFDKGKDYHKCESQNCQKCQKMLEGHTV